MKVGDTITIKNKAGMLRVRLEKELSLEDVTKCVGDDKIPDLVRPRLEYHQSTGYSGCLVTLCGNLNTTPFDMYLMYIPSIYEKPTCYLGVCDDSEADIFETVY